MVLLAAIILLRLIILDMNTKTVAASITRADLQIRANNDAKFVLQDDVAGYAGAS